MAGQRIHGTTRKQPLVVFRDEERHALGEWDAEPYEMTDWRTAKVHPDHHIACQYALYSVPSATCPPGQKVEVRLGSKLVRIYHRGKTDQGTPAPGSRRQIHRPRRLPGRAERLHPQSAGANQAQRGVTGTGRGSLCRASLRRPAALGQAQTGTQAHTPGRTLLP